CARVDNEDDYGFYYTWGPLNVW
nr:immunoglobulin heavy chain junction region [Macaca mulatta]